MSAFAERSLRPHFGKRGRARARPIERFAAAGDGPRPSPSGVMLPHDERCLPFPIMLGVEVGVADIGLARLEPAPLQLRADPLCGNQKPDRASAKVRAGIAVAEPLMTGQANDGEAFAELFLGADADERVRRNVLESALCLDQAAGGEQLDAGAGVGTQAPSGISDHARPPCKANDTSFGDRPPQRVALLVSPKEE